MKALSEQIQGVVHEDGSHERIWLNPASSFGGERKCMPHRGFRRIKLHGTLLRVALYFPIPHDGGSKGPVAGRDNSKRAAIIFGRVNRHS